MKSLGIILIVLVLVLFIRILFLNEGLESCSDDCGCDEYLLEKKNVEHDYRPRYAVKRY